MLQEASLVGAQVVELAPGLGRTAAQIVAAGPASYIGVDQDPEAVRLVEAVVRSGGRVVTADAAHTGLPDACADVVVGEAMLTMQSARGRTAVIAEAVRLLRPGGRYAIHELALHVDDSTDEAATAIRRDLARAIKVNARPATVAEWRAALEDEGLVVQWERTAPMALLALRRNLADEGLVGTVRIVANLVRDPAARRRVLEMRRTFMRHRGVLLGVAMVAHRPKKEAV